MRIHVSLKKVEHKVDTCVIKIKQMMIARPPLLQFLVLAAAVLSAQAAETGNFTSACTDDRLKLQNDPQVYKTVLQVVQESTAVVLDVIAACEKNTTTCSTPFGAGSCCTADGAGQWSKHQAVYEAYEVACANVEAGDLLWFVETVTTQGSSSSGELIVQSTYEHTLPLYISKNCQKEENLATLFGLLAQDCVVSQGTLLKCEYSLA